MSMRMLSKNFLANVDSGFECIAAELLETRPLKNEMSRNFEHNSVDRSLSIMSICFRFSSEMLTLISGRFEQEFLERTCKRFENIESFSILYSYTMRRLS